MTTGRDAVLGVEVPGVVVVSPFFAADQVLFEKKEALAASEGLVAVVEFLHCISLDLNIELDEVSSVDLAEPDADKAHHRVEPLLGHQSDALDHLSAPAPSDCRFGMVVAIHTDPSAACFDPAVVRSALNDWVGTLDSADSVATQLGSLVAVFRHRNLTCCTRFAASLQFFQKHSLAPTSLAPIDLCSKKQISVHVILATQVVTLTQNSTYSYSFRLSTGLLRTPQQRLDHELAP